jgi:CubicO group peptidase (beta-lactamase class C family)
MLGLGNAAHQRRLRVDVLAKFCAVWHPRGMTRCIVWLVLAAACAATNPRATSRELAPGRAPVPKEEADDALARLAKRIDAVMKPWANADTPGCAVAVMQDRKVIHAKGYGMADLEHGISITPDTVFYIGSISKQFTASAILLAAADNQLAIDDDIRTHVPSLPRIGPTQTTLRHLIHHTGGLRDYESLLVLAGHRLDDAPTVRQAIDALSRQRGRDFAPGTKFEYSNTGYVLLAQAVEHATKQSFAAYLDAKVFAPLQMTHTRVHEGHQQIIPGRAIGYAPIAGGWQTDVWRWGPTGDGGVFTTVLDLAKWDANFYDPRVGGRPFLDALHTRGKLSDGTELDYAAGLFHGSYRGQPTVVHPGGAAGYAAQLERFPALATSIAVLCNVPGARPDLLAHRIADVVLAQHLHGDPPAHESPPPTIQLTTAQLDAWVATYRDVETGGLVAIVRSDNVLELAVAGDRYALDATSDRTFLLRGEWFIVHLEGTAPHRKLVFRSPMDAIGEESYVEADLYRPTARELTALAGRYRSDEVGTEWVLALADGTLVATGPAFEGPAALVPATKDDFAIFAMAVDASIRFTRDRRGRITGFALRSGGMHGIRFDRVR